MEVRERNVSKQKIVRCNILFGNELEIGIIGWIRPIQIFRLVLRLLLLLFEDFKL